MIKHTVIWEVIRKHEKYEKHNIKIKYENKRNDNKGNYEVITNVRIDKQNIYVIGVVGVVVNIEMREKIILKYKNFNIKKELKVINKIKEMD